MRHLRGFSLCILILFIGITSKSQTKLTAVADQKKWDISFNTSSLEKILLNPEKVLTDPDEFWKTDGAYILSKRWHNNNRIPLDSKNYYNNWLASLKTFAEVPEDQRKNNPAFQMLEELQKRIPTFNDKSISLLNDFLPQNQLKFKTTIHLTTKTYSFAFMTNTQIVADVLSSYFKNDPDKIFNLLTHECYHIGYGINRYLRQEIELDNNFVYNGMLDALQNEGLATYVGYASQKFFPVKELQDYQLLDDPSEVKRLLAEVNFLFSIVDNLPVDSLQKKSREIGVNQRAYYVTGAFMAQTIDQKLGREALLKTISVGPLNFVDTYNSLADDEMKILTFKKPDQNSHFARLKKTAFDEDVTALNKVASEILEVKDNFTPVMLERLTKLGYGMIYKEDFDKAITIFRINTVLYPKEPNTFDCLAEAYLESGDKENAIHYYKEALKVDPNFKNAANKLAELE